MDESNVLTLPPELMLSIIELLSHKDQKTFCLLSHSSRQLALQTLFRKVVYSCNVAYRIEMLNEARGDIKAAIRKLVLDNGHEIWDYDSTQVLLAFLRSLPNLQSFRWNHRYSEWNRALIEVVASLQHCPLEHFTHWTLNGVPGRLTAPRRLRSLSFKSETGHIYDLIAPSFSTLVELEIWLSFPLLDLRPLRPVGITLRKFVYSAGVSDLGILDTIPDVFPYLTTLELIFRNLTRYPRWQNSYDDSTAKNTQLQYLSVFAKDFIFCDGDPWLSHRDCRKCGDQRNQATRTLAIACTGLKRCRWNHRCAQYCFDVRKSLEGNTPIRVESVPVTQEFKPFTDFLVLQPISE